MINLRKVTPMDKPKATDFLRDYLIVTNEHTGVVKCVHENDLAVLWHEVDEDWQEKDYNCLICSPDNNDYISNHLLDAGYIVDETRKWFPGNGEF